MTKARKAEHDEAVRELELKALALDLRERELQVQQVELDAERAAVEHREFLSDPSRRGVFFLTGEIDEESAHELIQSMITWTIHADDEDPLTLFINSGGGCLDSGMAIYDVVRDMAAHHDVMTVVRGQACSMAAIIAQAGDRRVIGEQSRMMVHQVSSLVAGPTNDIHAKAKQLIALDQRIARIFEDRSGGRLTREEYAARVTGQDWWLDADEAVKAGLVDDIG